MALHSSDNRFHYSLELEYALRELLGDKVRNHAGAYTMPKNVCEDMLAAVEKIRQRIENIVTTDDRLLLTTSLIINNLEKKIKAIKIENNNDLEIIASLMDLIARLLGFDWERGIPNRQLIYQQEEEQRDFDYANINPNDWGNNQTVKKRIEIVGMLFDQGIKIAQIARIMRLTNISVKSLLHHSGRVVPTRSQKSVIVDAGNEEAAAGSVAEIKNS